MGICCAGHVAGIGKVLGWARHPAGMSLGLAVNGGALD
jgi:hypothetical protein